VRRRKDQEFVCPQCSTSFVLSGKKLKDAIQNQKRKKIAGPFCNRKCVSKYGKAIQMGTCEKINSEKIIPEYYTLKTG